MSAEAKGLEENSLQQLTLLMSDGGRGQDRTADPFDVNEVLSR